MKVILNKSTKIKSKGFVLAGVEVDVTADEKKLLEKGGFLGEVRKSGMPSNEKEIKELVAKVKDLESKVKDGGNDELAKEIVTLKADLETKDAEIVTLKADLEKATKK